MSSFTEKYFMLLSLHALTVGYKLTRRICLYIAALRLKNSIVRFHFYFRSFLLLILFLGISVILLVIQVGHSFLPVCGPEVRPLWSYRAFLACAVKVCPTVCYLKNENVWLEFRETGVFLVSYAIQCYQCESSPRDGKFCRRTSEARLTDCGSGATFCSALVWMADGQ